MIKLWILMTFSSVWTTSYELLQPLCLTLLAPILSILFNVKQLYLLYCSREYWPVFGNLLCCTRWRLCRDPWVRMTYTTVTSILVTRSYMWIASFYLGHQFHVSASHLLFQVYTARPSLWPAVQVLIMSLEAAVSQDWKIQWVIISLSKVLLLKSNKYISLFN